MSVEEKLKWYFDVDRNKMPAKFLICKRIACDSEISGLEEKNLWEIHEKLSENFKKTWREIKEGELDLKEMEKPKVSYLDVKIELSKKILRNCRFCERRCGVDRRKERGFCGSKEKTYVSSYFLHFGEEPPLIPSGTIFFSGCNFKCVYCQNWEISQFPDNGFLTTAKDLSLIEENLRKSGARNINFVGGNPDQHLHTILESLKYLNVNVPVLWNNNAYSSEETMKILLDVVDIWLPDFKYGNDECAFRLSSVKNYTSVVQRNIKTMCENEDPLIIRHLVLPNHFECCTRRVLEWISKNCKNCLVNVMRQYRPEYLVLERIEKFKEISRVLTRDEIEKAYELASKLKLDFKEVS